jgi:multicomponent Na+:H+ antiporter subunit D
VAAQTLTIAALGRAGWQVFFGRPVDDYPRNERLRPGMLIALGTLMAACVGFGVLPTYLLRHVFAPAAGALLAGGRYGQNLLAGAGTLPSVAVPFSYFSGVELATVVLTVALAIPLARWAATGSHPRLAEFRAVVQTGSVNDYAAYQILGLVVTVAALALR